MKFYQKSTLLSLSLMLLVSCGGSSGGGGSSSSVSNTKDAFSACLSEVVRNHPGILDEGRSESVGACCSSLENRVLKDNYKDVYYDHIFPDSIAESMLDNGEVNDSPLWAITISKKTEQSLLDGLKGMIVGSYSTIGGTENLGELFRKIQQARENERGRQLLTSDKVHLLKYSLEILGYGTFLELACEQQKEAIESLHPTACSSTKAQILSLVDPFLNQSCKEVNPSTLKVSQASPKNKTDYLNCVEYGYKGYAQFFRYNMMSKCCQEHLGGSFNALGYPNTVKPDRIELVPVSVKPSQNYGGCEKNDGGCMAEVFGQAFYSKTGNFTQDDFSSELVKNMLLDMCTSNEMEQN